MTSATAPMEKGKKKKPSALEKVRNIGIVAHIDSGKTTITERMLKLSGRIRTLGEVHDGEATMDFLKEERERGITIGSAATFFEWGGCDVYLIDTPGHVDFTAEVERSLRVLDGAVLAIDSVAGAQAQSETVNRQLNKYKTPRIAFINKMDRVGADFHRAVQSLGERLSLNAAPIQLPVGEGPEFRGAIDLVAMQQINFPEASDDPAAFTRTDIEEGQVEAARAARHHLLEALSMYSDELMEMFLEEGEPPLELIASVMRHATAKESFVPCMLGSALRNRGVPALLDAVNAYLPNPVERGAVAGVRPGTEEEVAFEPDPEAPLGAIAFKTVHFSTGDLTFVRLYSGSFEAGEGLYNPRLGKHERVGRIFLMHAGSKEPIEKATAGQIVACMGLKEASTGDTLCRKKDAVAYGSTTFAKPVISMAIEPVSTADRDKLGEILGIVSREDPTFLTYTDEETGETIIAGMGELHLEVVKHRIRDEFRVVVNTGKPRVSYRQTLSKAASFESRHVKQTGGSGQFAVAQVEFEPIESDEIEVINTITQGKITKEFLTAMEKGIREYLVGGGRAGAQIVGVRATIVDGKMHDVDSSQVAFYACGVLAARTAEERCKTQLLEPIMRLEIVVPEDYLGTVLGDVNSRRGTVVDIEDGLTGKTLRCRVPLAELAAYSTTLRSITSGRGDYSMEPDGYHTVPVTVLEKLRKEGLFRE
jgi:elongation factor G